MSERERMLAGAPYNSRDAELLSMAHRARALLAEFAALPSTAAAARHALLTQLLGSVGDGVWIEPPFFVDYGTHVHIGANTFLNVNCVLLDAAPIHIGANGLLGPGVQLLTATHPLRAADRVVATHDASQSPYRTHAAPIRIGDNVWIGVGTLILPGVTIGDNVTIGAGSVVTKDVPSDALAFGNPCHVQRTL